MSHKTSNCPKPEPLGNIFCYGNNSSDIYYEVNDNETDGSFSIGGTDSNTLKWEVESPASESDGLSDITLAAKDCIDNEGVATFLITDSEGFSYTFLSDTYSEGNTDGTGSWSFSGQGGGPSGSGKIFSSSLSCSSNGSGKSYALWDCESGAVVFYDLITDELLADDQVLTIKPCPVETISDCPEIGTSELIRCASEATQTINGTTVNTGDQIFTIIQTDCENNVLSSVSYHVLSGEEVEGPFTEECDPEPQLETIRLCILDVDGVEWVQVSIVDLDNPENPTTLYYNEFNKLGTPSGNADEWTACEGSYVAYDNVKLCEIDARFLLLIDSGGRFARYSFYTKTWEDVSTLSVNSAGGSADVENFLLYNFVAPDQLTVIDVNTDTQLPNITVIDGTSINPNALTNPKTFSAASFRVSDGFLYAQDTGGADAGLYKINVSTGEVDFVTTITGVSGTGTSIMIDNTTDTLIVNGSNLSYEVDWVNGTSTVWGNPPIQPNGGTFDTSGNAYVTQGDNTYYLPVGSDPNDTSSWINIIDDWSPGANSIAYYETEAASPSCFNRRFGVRPDGTRDFIGDFNVLDDSPRTVVGDVDCCECVCGGGGSGSGDSTPSTQGVVRGRHEELTGTSSVGFIGSANPTDIRSITVNVVQGTANITDANTNTISYPRGSYTWSSTGDNELTNGLLRAVQAGGSSSRVIVHWTEYV